MNHAGRSNRWRSALVATGAATLVVLDAGLMPTDAKAQDEGGLYVAGAGFTFQVAAQRAMAQNPGGRAFFLLAVPPETAALTVTAPPALAALRERVRAANGVLMVCQRDIDNRRIALAELAPGVVAVRGWPAPAGVAAGERLFPGENPAALPASDVALRRLRSACAE